MKSYEDIQLELLSNLFCASVYYLPLGLLEMAGETTPVLLNHANRMLLFEKNGHNYLVDQQPVSVHVFSKSFLLDNNMYILLELIDTEPKSKVEFLIDRYTTYVQGFVHIYNYYVEYVKMDIPDVSKDQYNGFVQQLNITKQHLEELKERFDKKAKNKSEVKQVSVSENKALEETLEEVKRVLIPNASKDSDKLEFKLKETKASKAQDKRKRHIEELKEQARSEAEFVLLTQVFNVPLETN
ncbi:hypothetical protein [Aestuariibaculum sediminum]|uniref:Uncharacterized protein n=1 Tax=Aestuariibaculum sediminum TaxID=2770637 RepID=A0A8J6QCV9_9FLAO|nr:hypothetical protein [Aestuariibaculum sediminum]MBD0833766.1 hypothetical protein [Aestuariibaculum sediminum]